MSDAARFLDGLRRQQEKYREMSAVAASQREAFASLDVDGILGLIEKKRAILTEVERLEAELAPFKADWARVRQEFSPGELRELDQMLDGTQQVLAELVRTEDEGRGMLERRKEGSAPSLQDQVKRGRARNAYPAR